MIETIVRRTIDPAWRFTQSGAVGLYLERGLKELPAVYGLNEIDDERIVDYIVYQIYRVRRHIENGAWQSTWLFSQYAKDKFKKQFFSEDGKSGMNYYINLWLDEAELTRGDLIKIIAKRKPSPLRQMIYLESEEAIKQRFLNSAEGLALCLSSTTGWCPLSNTCKQCENREQCEETTARKYPELVRYRKEAAHGKEN